MNTVYYIGDVGREGSAKFVHAQGIAKLFEKINYDIVFMCEGSEAYEIEKSIEGFKFKYTRQYITKTKLRSVENVFEWICGIKLWGLLKRNVKEKKPDIIVLYGNVFEKKLIRFCKKKGIKLLLERVDWFEKEDCVYWVEKVIQKQAEKNITYNDFTADGIIAISNYFYDYYSKEKVNVIQIPPLFDWKFSSKPAFKSKYTTINLVYAGSLAGGKDSIESALRAVMQLNQEEIIFRFDIVGVTEAEIDNMVKNSDWKKLGIIAHGKLSHDKTLKIVRNADYSFLLRENKRYAKAGFSTKFCESMFQGVPVICTRVGGADSCVTNFCNGILIENNELETLLKVLNRIATMNRSEIMKMKLNAYNTAQRLFTPDAYISAFDNFIRNL